MAILTGKISWSPKLLAQLNKIVTPDFSVLIKATRAASDAMIKFIKIDKVRSIEAKYDRPEWASMLCRLDCRAAGDLMPYYWLGEGRYKRVTSKRIYHPLAGYHTDIFTVIKEYKVTRYQRPFFEELKYATQLEE